MSTESIVRERPAEVGRVEVVPVAPPEVRPLWRTRSYLVFLALIGVVYVAVYGSLLAVSDGVPYVFDNNESFSSLWHAANLYNFGLSKSFGLTDEAYGPNPDAHPYVHTHQGNFPRLFAFLIYVLGARTIESQIFVTTFTVGIVAVFLTYHIFARLAGPLLAFVTCLVLLTDYIHVAQWHVVTYRVWHLFFIFTSLACAYGIGGPRRRLWLVLTFVNYLFLFYYELIFVAFVGLLGALFVAGRYWRRPRLVVTAGLVQFAGAATSLLILFTQLALYLGWNDFISDLSLTYVARNNSTADSPLISQLDDFYQRNHIVFWYNIVDGGSLRTLAKFADLHGKLVLQIYTPLLTLMALTLAVGWLLGLVGGSRWSRTLPGRVGAILGCALLFVPSALLLATVFRDGAFAGLPATASVLDVRANSLGIVAGLIGAALSTLLMTRAATGRWLDVGRLPLGRAAAVGVFLLVLAQLVDAQANFYDQYFQPVWYDRLVEVVPIWATRAAFLLVVGLAALVALLGNVRVFGEARHRQLLGLGAYLACAGLAYLGDYLLATGYVYSGYILRSAPLVVFFLGVFYAFGACIVVSALVRALTVVRERSEAHQYAHGLNGVAGANGLDGSARQTAPIRSPLALGGLAASALLLVWMATYWAVLNRSYVDLFPPNQVGFLKQLAEPPYRGASVVSNAYAAPIAWYTQQWAYLDTEFGNGNVRLGDYGYEVDSNPNYLWLADKQENPSYARPDYFVCFRQQGIEAGNARLHAVRYLAYYSCSDVSILRKIEQKKQQFLQHQIVAQDPVYPPQWAILKLDWEFPPYLAPFDPSRPADLTRIVTTPTADGLSVQVQYRYVQDDGLPEAGSTVRLYGVGPKEERCVLGRRSDGGMFTLPPGFQGTVQASVAPRSTSKPGPEIFGEPVAIGDGRADACAGR